MPPGTGPGAKRKLDADIKSEGFEIMAKKKAVSKESKLVAASAGRPSALVDTRVIYCGDNLEQLKKLPENCVDLIYIDPPFNSNRNYEVFWGETKEKRSFDDRHAYIEFMRPRCEELHRQKKIWR
jgi:16S rRNA G966 N2-methylase RsmD